MKFLKYLLDELPIVDDLKEQIKFCIQYINQLIMMSNPRNHLEYSNEELTLHVGSH
jgi:hypothetical protein